MRILLFTIWNNRRYNSHIINNLCYNFRKGLAIDVLIGDLPLDEDAPFLYPPGDISVSE